MKKQTYLPKTYNRIRELVRLIGFCKSRLDGLPENCRKPIISPYSPTDTHTTEISDISRKRLVGNPALNAGLHPQTHIREKHKHKVLKW